MAFPFETSGDDDSSLSMPLVSLDPDGTVRFVDDAFAEMAGHEPATVVGSAFVDYIETDDDEQFDAALSELDSHGRLETELSVRTASGSTVPVQLDGQPETDADGTISRVHCRLAPRSDSTGGVGTLQERNVLLRTLFDGLPMGILAETADRRVLAANEAVLSLFDFEGGVDEVIGADCIELAAGVSEQFADPSGFREGIEARIAAGDSTYGERLVMADDRVLERYYFPIDLPVGSGHLWIYENVTDTERRRSELETYERLFEVAPVGVFRTTTDGRVLSVNRKLAEILGYEEADGLLADYHDLERDLYVDPDRRSTFLDCLRQQGFVENFEYRAITRSGGRRWLSMNARVLDETHDSDRVITGFTWDVTERKQHERLLAVLGRVLRHNLRNAMTVILGQAELLATGDAEDSERAAAALIDRADALLQQADKERRIVERLRETTTKTTRDLGDMIEAVSEEVRQEYPGATIAADCPDLVTVSVCVGFEQAIRELLDNAIQHSDADSPSVTVTVESSSDSVEMRIADRGPAIPEVERQLLRGDADETPLYHGVGVGLVLVRQLVHSSGGRMSLEENEPRGNVVTVTVPLAEA